MSLHGNIVMGSQADIIDKLIYERLKSDPKILKSVDSYDESAQSSYQIVKDYYLFNENELELLEKITECDTFIFKVMLEHRRQKDQYVKEKIDYQAILQTEINARTTYNANKYFWQPAKDTSKLIAQLAWMQNNPRFTSVAYNTNTFTYLINAYTASIDEKKKDIDTFSKSLLRFLPWNWFKTRSTDHLKIVTDYVSSHSESRQHAISPFHQHASIPYDVRPVNNSFLQTMRGLWAGLTGINRNIKKLENAYNHKTEEAEMKLSSINLPARRIAVEYIQQSNNPRDLISYLNTESNSENFTKALIKIDAIFENQAYKQYCELLTKERLPAYLQDDLDMLNLITDFDKVIKEMATTMSSEMIERLKVSLEGLMIKIKPLVPVPAIDGATESMIDVETSSTISSSSKSTDSSLTLTGLVEEESKVSDESPIGNLYTKLNILANKLTNKQTPILSELQQVIKSLNKIEITEILPSKKFSQPTDPDFKIKYQTEIKNFADNHDKTIGKILEKNIPVLGRMDPVRFVSNYALEPKGGYSRDDFAVRIVNSCYAYVELKTNATKLTFDKRYTDKVLAQNNPPTNLDCDFLFDLKDLVNASRVITAHEVRNFITVNRSAQKPTSTNSIMHAYTTALANCNNCYNTLIKLADQQRNLLDVYLIYLAKCKEALSNPSDPVCIKIKQFLDAVCPSLSKASDDQRVDQLIKKANAERDYMNTVVYEALKVKQAAKFVVGNLTYAVNKPEGEAMKQRVR